MQGSESGGAIGRPGRWTWRVGAAGAVITVLLLVVPGSMGAAPVGGKVYAAPFHHVNQASLSTQTLGVCSTANVTLVPTFSPTTGRSATNMSASTDSCAHSVNVGEWDGVAGGIRYLAIPLTFGGTHHHLTVNVTFVGNLSTSIRLAGTCPNATVPARGNSYQYCDISADAEFNIFWRVLNATGVILSTSGGNGISVQAYSSYDTYSSCTSKGVCTNSTSSQLGGTGTNWTGSLTRAVTEKLLGSSLQGQGRHYTLWIQIESQAYTMFESDPSQGLIGSQASAATNFNAPGTGAKLNSVTIS